MPAGRAAARKISIGHRAGKGARIAGETLEHGCHVMTARPWARGVRRIFASGERTGRDAAQILADGLGLGGYHVIADLGENDRSATGFLAKESSR